VFIQDGAQPLHHLAVKSGVVNINTVNITGTGKPGNPFEKKIVQASGATSCWTKPLRGRQQLSFVRTGQNSML